MKTKSRPYYDGVEAKIAKWKLKGLGVPGEVWYLGEWKEKVFERAVGVVGSRRMTEYGRRVIEKLVPKLVDQGWTIVSGFMYGVDQEAHRVCVECGGKTVAVLGWGINERLETSDQRLADEIVASGGLIISQWEKQKGTLWTFPARNRIVAALSSEIYVVEAAAKSGALITAEMGRQLGKKIWAVPGPITSSVSVGTNRLIASGQAKMWLPDLGTRQEAIGTSNGAEVYVALQSDALTVDELVRKTGRSPQDIGVELTMMTLRGEVVEREGKYYLIAEL